MVIEVQVEVQVLEVMEKEARVVEILQLRNIFQKELQLKLEAENLLEILGKDTLLVKNKINLKILK